MIVVADSGPLHYLILLQHIELLRRFYGQVLVPEPVASELSAAGAPVMVREWITEPPIWVADGCRAIGASARRALARPAHPFGDEGRERRDVHVDAGPVQSEEVRVPVFNSDHRPWIST